MNILMFIAIFGASVGGAQIFGQSLNKIALLPLMVYVFAADRAVFTNKMKISREQRNVLLWYIINIVSCISGLFYEQLIDTNVIGLPIAEFKMMAQILLIYMPLSLGIWVSPKKYLYKESMIKCLKIVVKIHAMWGILQFVLYYGFKFGLNNYVFDEMWGGMLGAAISDGGWQDMLYFSGFGGFLRVTGLNNDSAYFGILLVIGMIFETNILWKFIYILCSILSFSRTTIVLIVFVLLFSFFCENHGKLDHSFIRKVKQVALIIISVGLFYILIINIPIIGDISGRFISRFAQISSGENSGTNRHMNYLGCAIIVWFKYILFNKLFGIGITAGGCAFRYYIKYIPQIKLSRSMKLNTRIWAVEMDYANCLLGTGIIGFMMYFCMHISFLKKNKKDKKIYALVMALLIAGVMYNYCTVTLINLMYIILFSIGNDTLPEVRDIQKMISYNEKEANI